MSGKKPQLFSPANDIRVLHSSVTVGMSPDEHLSQNIKFYIQNDTRLMGPKYLVFTAVFSDNGSESFSLEKITSGAVADGSNWHDNAAENELHCWLNTSPNTQAIKVNVKPEELLHQNPFPKLLDTLHLGKKCKARCAQLMTVFERAARENKLQLNDEILEKIFMPQIALRSAER